MTGFITQLQYTQTAVIRLLAFMMTLNTGTHGDTSFLNWSINLRAIIFSHDVLFEVFQPLCIVNHKSFLV